MMCSKNICKLLMSVLVLLMAVPAQAGDEPAYKQSPEYLALRDSMHHAFNDGDSARFYQAVKVLQDYLLQQDDVHDYYTQRCNEIVFELNQQHIFEADKLAIQLSKELSEKKLDSEMYMAINMMGHINNYCGNKEGAKRCFREVIRRMEHEGYTESIPPILMNLVNIIINEDPQEALKLIDRALEISSEKSPQRVFDIETRRTLAYYNMGDEAEFLKGYKAYKDGVAQGLSSVHGRKLEICYLEQQGRIDEALKLAAETTEDPFETQAGILSRAGRWQEAYEAMEKGAKETDSIKSLLLSSSVQGIQNELRINDIKRHEGRVIMYGMLAVTALLVLLIIALVYIYLSRRRHWRQMDEAYQRVLKADEMKTEFIQNVSHEVRTPLNIISGFAQVLAAPGSRLSDEERRHISETMMHNTNLITTMINEVLEISRGDISTAQVERVPLVCNDTLRKVLDSFCKKMYCNRSLLHYESAVADNVTILSDVTFLEHILYPLLDNAYKNVSPTEGRIVVKAAVDNDVLTVRVEDNGAGIPADKGDTVFDRFVKLDTFKEGLGLGLPFSRMMARRMQGDVVLDKDYPGPGACFVVTLPIKN